MFQWIRSSPSLNKRRRPFGDLSLMQNVTRTSLNTGLSKAYLNGESKTYINRVWSVPAVSGTWRPYIAEGVPPVCATWVRCHSCWYPLYFIPFLTLNKNSLESLHDIHITYFVPRFFLNKRLITKNSSANKIGNKKIPKEPINFCCNRHSNN